MSIIPFFNVPPLNQLGLRLQHVVHRTCKHRQNVNTYITSLCTCHNFGAIIITMKRTHLGNRKDKSETNVSAEGDFQPNVRP